MVSEPSLQEEKEVHTKAAVLATEESARNTSTSHLLASIREDVSSILVSVFQSAIALIQGAVEALDLVDPELKVTFGGVLVACERHLRCTAREGVDDTLVGHVAELVVVEDRLAALVAHHILRVDLTVFEAVTCGLAC
jgi:hypothetical protein